MAGAITGMGTTFNLPNYVGELFALTPADTPFLSAIGGLTGGGMTDATEMEWQSYDLGDPSQQKTALEGATAPTAEAIARGNVRNALEIHQKRVSVSYTKQAAVGQITTPSGPPARGVPGSNPVTNELDFQVQKQLQRIALDLNWVCINGVYQLPTDNTTPRKTRGILAAVQTNRIALGTAGPTASTATDTVTSTAHGLSNGATIVFTYTDVATGIIAGRVYYVSNVTTNTFKVSGTAAGSAITLGTAANLTYTVPSGTALTAGNVNSLAQMAYDNGGLSEQATATLVVNSRQKVNLTTAYAGQYRQADPLTGRNVGGVAVDTVVTDFGTFGVMVDRHMPQDTILLCSMEQLMPVFLNIPGKGTLFSEPLAKTGSSTEEQLYCEFGLAYGNERAHAVLTGAKL